MLGAVGRALRISEIIACARTNRRVAVMLDRVRSCRTQAWLDGSWSSVISLECQQRLIGDLVSCSLVLPCKSTLA